jgi:5-methylcytosine-specific restriction endonuclease McrA
MVPCNYADYPPDWKQIRDRILARAGNKCEQCGVPNLEHGSRDSTGKWWSSAEQYQYAEANDGDLPADLSYEASPLIKIVLTIAHVDHDTTNNDESNLRAWCQRCHNRHDAPYRAKNAAATRERKKGQCSLELT